MKKVTSILLTIAMFLSVVSITYHFVRTKTNYVSITVGESTKFSQEEIENAVDAAKLRFLKLEHCKLISLTYDEEKSNQEVKSYLTCGRGSIDGSTSENTLVLQSKFYMDKDIYQVGSFIPDSYGHWKITLTRQDKNSDWTVSECGY